MKKILLIFVLSFNFLGCVIENTNIQEEDINAFSIEGKTYELVSYVIERAVDLNGDNVFSVELLEEDASCFIEELFFDVDNLFWPPNRSTIAFTVINGVQNFHCVQPDGSRLSYLQDGTIIDVSYNGQFYFEGELTDDNNTLTFVIPNTYLHGFGFFGSNDFLNENGFIEEYDGNATLTYQLVE